MKKNMPLWKMILLLIGIIVFLYLTMATVFSDSDNSTLNNALFIADMFLIFIALEDKNKKE